MMNVYTIIKHNFRRAASRRTYILLSLGITFATILLAVYFTSRFEFKGNIALISKEKTPVMQSSGLNIHLLEAVPPRSQLVMNKYDAVVIDKGNGEYEVDTIKNKKFEESILKIFQNPGILEVEGDQSSKAGTGILGYMIMFLMLQGLFFMTFFTEDKERKNLKRIATSPASIGSYLAGIGIFNFSMLYVPTMAVLVVSKEVLKVNIGFSYLQYLYLLAMIALFSTAFALFMTATIEKQDNVMTGAATIVVLTSILSGSFSAINTGSSAINGLISLLPQKAYLSMVYGLENGKSFTGYLLQAGYIILLSLAMAAAGAVICRKRYNEGRY